MDTLINLRTKAVNASLRYSVQTLWTNPAKPPCVWYVAASLYPRPIISHTVDERKTNVRLPLPVEQPGAPQIYTKEVQVKMATFFRDRLFEKWNTYPAIYFHGGAMWCRISVQVWTEVRRVSFLHTASPHSYFSVVVGLRICRQGFDGIMQGSS